MAWFYCAKSNGFFSNEIHGSSIPNGAIPISVPERNRLLTGSENGQEIFLNPKGRPDLRAPAAPCLNDTKSAKLAELGRYCRAEVNKICDKFGIVNEERFMRLYEEYSAWKKNKRTARLLSDRLAELAGKTREEFMLNFETEKAPAFQLITSVIAKSDELSAMLVAAGSLSEANAIRLDLISNAAK